LLFLWQLRSDLKAAEHNVNRKERRRQQKLAGQGPAQRRPALTASSSPGAVSALLMRHAGQGATPIDPAALEIVAAQAATGPVDAAFAKLRREELLQQQLATIERALAANPGSVELLLTLAKLFRHMDRPQDALGAYRRVLEIDPARQDVQHMIAALAGVAPGEAPARAADAYVAEEFDGFAARYDEVLVGWLEYRGPEILHRAVLAALGANPPPQDVIDLGCGTGLAARLFRPLAHRLDGVDLSAKMIEKARGRGLYDALHVDEIGRYLARMPQAYTLAIAADVLIYFGDLAPVFADVAAALRPGGIFAFTLEAGSGAPYRLTQSGRYAHDDAYVRATATASGFDVVRATDETVRKEKLKPVQSRCYVLRKTD
jgi:predicted TPR repeat methyltransferase